MPELLSAYELIRCIGIGGMAEVHLARHREAPAERPVVVKRLLPKFARKPEYAQMFMDEARLGMRMKHPNVVETIGWGLAGGTPFMVMECVDGPQLGDVVTRLAERGQKVPVHVAAAIISKAALGLHHAHGLTDDAGRALQVVHRDVGPQNIMVTRTGDVKVVDFGVAKARTQASTTQAGVLKGKVGYSSPEQCACKPLDRRSDVWALGVTLHELLTGTRLFVGENPLELMQRIIRGHIAVPSSVDRGIPRDLDSVVMSALTQNVDRRTPDAASFANQLQEFLNRSGQPMPAAALAAWLARDVGDLLGEPLAGPAPAPAEYEILSVEERRQGFYTRLFGLPDLQILGAERIFVTPELAVLERQDPTARKVSGQWMPFFVVSAVDAVLQHVESVGGRVVQPLTRAENGWFAIVEDDATNLLGVFSHAV